MRREIPQAGLALVHRLQRLAFSRSKDWGCQVSAESPHYDNSGVLFPNSEKWQAQKDGRPQFGGECTIEGRRFRVAAWNKVGKTGLSFLALAFSAPQAKPYPKVKPDQGQQHP